MPFYAIFRYQIQTQHRDSIAFEHLLKSYKKHNDYGNEVHNYDNQPSKQIAVLSSAKYTVTNTNQCSQFIKLCHN